MPGSCKILPSNFEGGPLVFMEKVKWDPNLAVRSLLRKSDDVSAFPFLKLRGVERQRAIDMITR